MIYRIAILGAALIQLAACQSSEQKSTTAAAASPPAAETEVAFASPAQSAVSPAQCAITIAAGPPGKPNKGGDFGKATAKNVGKNVGRNLIANIGSAVAGPLGGAVAGGVAVSTIRTEQDLKGPLDGDRRVAELRLFARRQFSDEPADEDREQGQARHLSIAATRSGAGQTLDAWLFVHRL